MKNRSHISRSWLPSALAAALAVAFLSPAASASVQSEPARPVKLFVLSGQSNMGGGGRLGHLPPEVAAQFPRTDIWYDHAGQTGVVDDAWKPLDDVQAQFGPELFFGTTVAAGLPDHRVAIVKQSTG